MEWKIKQLLRALHVRCAILEWNFILLMVKYSNIDCCIVSGKIIDSQMQLQFFKCVLE